MLKKNVATRKQLRMPNYEQNFTAAGFKILQRCTLEKAPANLRERSDALIKALGVSADQIVKAMALQRKHPDGSTTPCILLLPANERCDLKVLSKVMNSEFDFYPQEKIEADFGSPMNALTIFNLKPEGNCPLVDGRIIEQESLVVASGDPGSFS